MIVYEYVGLNGKGPKMSKEDLKTRIQDQDFQGIDGYHFSVERMVEGEFKLGQLTNYGRVFDAEQSLCQVGFWLPLSKEDLIKYYKEERLIH